MQLPIRLSLLFLITGITVHAAEVRMAVSDLIADYASKTIRTLAEESSVEVEVISSGSLPAIEALRADEIALAIVAVPEEMSFPKLSDEIFSTITIAYSTAIIAVNADNPIDEVSLHDLRGIFSAEAELNIETWEMLGAVSLSGRSIKPLVMQAEQGISTELFRHEVLQGEPMKLTVNEVIRSEIEKILASKITFVAVLSYLPDNADIKALMLSTDPESPAFDPTNENVHYGDYPIRLPFQIVYRKDREPELAEIIRILLSDEMTETLKANHLFVPPRVLVNGE